MAASGGESPAGKQGSCGIAHVEGRDVGRRGECPRALGSDTNPLIPPFVRVATAACRD